MKKPILYICLILLVSCHSASYMHDIDSTPYAIDYREGKWLLNEVSSPLDIKQKLTKIAYDGFYKNLGAQLKKSEDLTNMSLSYIPINPDKLLLQRVKQETEFDYLINIESKSSENDIGSLKIGQTHSRQRNVAQTTLEVYDLNTSEIIYSRKVTGQVTVDESDNEDFAFVKGNNGIMISCLKKIMKKIN